ncbi:hypothetical protein [Streptomyces sp. NPDC050535]|uniref:hypothetical protein n=1 Tax=Streptomyces sp. NPDC050535 TaxID=3365626 RepID=UPI003793F4D9
MTVVAVLVRHRGPPVTVVAPVPHLTTLLEVFGLHDEVLLAISLAGDTTLENAGTGMDETTVPLVS